MWNICQREISPARLITSTSQVGCTPCTTKQLVRGTQPTRLGFIYFSPTLQTQSIKILASALSIARSCKQA